jgi:hypothetical protein
LTSGFLLYCCGSQLSVVQFPAQYHRRAPPPSEEQALQNSATFRTPRSIEDCTLIHRNRSNLLFCQGSHVGMSRSMLEFAGGSGDIIAPMVFLTSMAERTAA